MSQVLPSYRLLQPAQRALVDALISRIEPEAIKTHRLVMDVLTETLDKHIALFTDREQAMLRDSIVIASLYDRANTIDDRMRLAEASIMKADQVIIEAHLGWFYDFEAEEFDWSNVTPEQLLAIEGFEVEEKPDGTRKYKLKLYNKHSSLERQSKIQQMQGQHSTYWERVKMQRESGANQHKAVGNSVEEQSKRYDEFLNKF